MLNPPSGNRRVVVATVVVSLLTFMAILWLIPSLRNVAETVKSDASTEIADGNGAALSSSSAQLTGSSACLSCHESEHASYLHTAHSQALSVVNPAKEPSDVSFSHEPSGRSYSVFRKEGALWHSEEVSARKSRITDSVNPEELQIAERLKYLIGSGRHSRTYAVERNGFLIESPVTWYQSSQKWAMSPGYDHSHHESFERAIDFGCLVCHVGSVDVAQESSGPLKILETAIGCERCHGPGGDHVKKWKNNVPVSLRNIPDSTIVNPRRLTRERGESICAQCHLRGDATILVSGKSLRDFVPGMLLTDMRIDYRLTTDDKSMKVVGHVDQMHASRCFQQSEELDCMTCHNMHQDATEFNAREFFRSQCLECHHESSCGIPQEQRLQDGNNDCVNCHMPQVPTDIPHIAFTHHRIGIHGQTSVDSGENSAEATLVPFYSVSESSPSDKTIGETQRNLALAYLELADKQSDPEVGLKYRQKSAQMLQQVVETDAADGDVFAAMGRMAWDQNDPEAAVQVSQLALAHSRLSDGARMNSLLVLGDSHLQLNQSALAVDHLRQLTGLRNRSQDWWLLGIALYQSGGRQEGLTALAKAVSIQPLRSDIRRTYSQILKAEGRNEEANEQQRLADYLEEL